MPVAARRRAAAKARGWRKTEAVDDPSPGGLCQRCRFERAAPSRKLPGRFGGCDHATVVDPGR